ncbi:hypothetical protein Salat_0231400 [Sesamum alatum]|uniref:VQ domain-containing protein n=1 Tax=Sesamum alatum TaxID=300844 RepID=A0AAE1YZW8_9LAMI|nr:hypothetical protein Salat_0231400 [Sesamum alatum]
MGKKSIQPSKKQTVVPKQEKKQQINNLIKILRPKVFITDSSNFKRLVQELTGNGNSPVSSPPNYYPSISAASPPSGLPFMDVQDHVYQDNSLDLSFDSSCFSTPLDGSPDLQAPDSCNYVMENLGQPDHNQTFDFSSYKDLESLLLVENDDHSGSYNYNDASCGMFHQQEVCVYDYDFSSLI